MDLPELEEKIIEYQTAYQNGEVKPKTYTDKDKMIALFTFDFLPNSDKLILCSSKYSIKISLTADSLLIIYLLS